MSKYLEETDYPINNDPVWALFENIYNKYYLECNNRTPSIPKLLHHIWLGGEFPDKYKRLRDTWLTIHPDWIYKCWGDNDAKDFEMTNRKAFDTVENLGAKSDIFRYEILNKYGGMYIDTDFECIKSFNDLLYLDFFCGDGWDKEPLIYNGLMACKPNNVFIQSIIQGLQGKEFGTKYGLDKILPLTGVYFITKLFIEYIKNTTDKVVCFPKNYFYALPNSFRLEIREDNEANRRRIYSYIKPSSYCIHMWYTSWQ